MELTAADAGELTLTARSEPLASTLPAYYFPSTPVGARNGQRLLAPDAQRVTGSSAVTVGKVRIAASTVARPGTVLVGQPARDEVKLTGALPSYRGTVRWALYGPFRAVSQIVVQRRACGARDVPGQRARARTERTPRGLPDRASTRTRR